ncbi:MAG: nucleotidyltransferase domain-containing protein [Muribaculaceae bacterium]|nr:nucleotidyltransferase domain-containing protein [Muribaculaceae bacterium]MDE6753651.1 nucleotidyltransferase domain-containing protein [Muribaculaceae bacterium]
MMRDLGLTNEELDEVIGYLKKNPKIRKAIVFGSRAKGNYRTFSDVDLTLLGTNLTISDLSALEEDLYYSYLPYIFDVSIFESIKNSALREHIERVGVEIYSS